MATGPESLNGSPNVHLVHEYPLDEESSREDLHTYAWIVNRSIHRKRKTSNKQYYLDAGCLRKMTFALHIAHKNSWRNGGSYSSLTWGQEIMASDGQIWVGMYLYQTHKEEFKALVNELFASKELIDNDSTPLDYITRLHEACEGDGSILAVAM